MPFYTFLDREIRKPRRPREKYDERLTDVAAAFQLNTEKQRRLSKHTGAAAIYGFGIYVEKID